MYCAANRWVCINRWRNRVYLGGFVCASRQGTDDRWDCTVSVHWVCFMREPVTLISEVNAPNAFVSRLGRTCVRVFTSALVGQPRGEELLYTLAAELGITNGGYRRRRRRVRRQESIIARLTNYFREQSKTRGKNALNCPRRLMTGKSPDRLSRRSINTTHVVCDRFCL